MKRVPLHELKDDLSRYLRQAESEEIIITRHGKPAGVLVGFKSEEDWFDYLLENDPRFLERVAGAHRSIRAGKGIPVEHREEKLLVSFYDPATRRPPPAGRGLSLQESRQARPTPRRRAPGRRARRRVPVGAPGVEAGVG